MTRHRCAVALVVVITVCCGTPTFAQSVGAAGRPGSAPQIERTLSGPSNPAVERTVSGPPGSRGCGDAGSAPLITGTLHGIARVPSRDSLETLAIGAAAALGGHGADSNVSDALSGGNTLDRVFRPGATVGGMPFEVGAAAAIAGLGRAIHKPCLGTLGSELLQAQLVGAAWTIGIKQVARRDRPEGGGFSFPSGHAATAFASATVLQRRFGWKAGIPAYAVASYVAASRIEMRRHYLSDVAFGAALGIVAGKSVTVGHGHELVIGPLATRRGAGVGFSLLPKQAGRVPVFGPAYPSQDAHPE